MLTLKKNALIKLKILRKPFHNKIYQTLVGVRLMVFQISLYKFLQMFKQWLRVDKLV